MVSRICSRGPSLWVWKVTYVQIENAPAPARSGDVIYRDTYIFGLSSETCGRDDAIPLYLLSCDREWTVAAVCKIAIFIRPDNCQTSRTIDFFPFNFETMKLIKIEEC